MPRPLASQRPARRAARIASGALAALLVGVVAHAEPEVLALPDSLAAFAGRWVRTEHARDDATRTAQIERVTASMSFVTRGFARSVMQSRMQPAAEIALTRGTDALAVLADAEERPALQPDGRLRQTPNSEVTDRLLPDGRIERTWNRGGDEGRGVVVWEVSPDGTLLFVRATAHNPHYEGAMQYTTTYRRAGDETAH